MNNFKKYRDIKGVSQQEVATYLGLSRQAYNFYENAKREASYEMLLKLSEYFNTTVDCLLSRELTSDALYVSNLVPITTKKIPLLGEIACGELKYAEEDFNGYVECGADVGADFALRCKGDSMVGARILDGDIVFIRKQPTVENGDIAAVMEEDTATLKRFRMAGNMVILSPENSAYDDIVVNLDEESSFRIIGKAVAFQSDVR